MSIIQDKRVAAQATYDHHLQALAAAKKAYADGPAAAYATALARHAALTTKLADAKAAATQHEATFRAQFAGADYEMSKATREALSKRREADLVCSELQVAADQVERDLRRIELEGSELALIYRQAYESALRAHGDLLLLNALADHGEPLAVALASVPTDHATGVHRDAHLRVQGEANERAVQFVMTALKAMAEKVEGVARPEEIKFDPGSLRGRLTTSPTLLNQLRRAAGVSRVAQVEPAMEEAAPAPASPIRRHRQGATGRAAQAS